MLNATRDSRTGSSAARGSRLGIEAGRMAAHPQRHTMLGGLVGLLLGGGGFLLIVLGLFLGWLLPKLWLASSASAA